MNPSKINESFDNMGVGEIFNQAKSLEINDDDNEGHSDMETLDDSGMSRNHSDDQLSNITIHETEVGLDDSNEKEDIYQHGPCQYNEMKAMAAVKEVETQTNTRDRQELYQGPNVRWVNVRFSEHEGHLTGYRLLLKMRSAIQSQEATITMKPQCADGPFWVSIEVVGPAENARSRYGGFENRWAVLSAAKDIVVAWLGRVRDEGLPFEKDVVFRKVHCRNSTLRLYAPPKESSRGAMQ
ncbi:uncharacterized protein N7458_008155 [Penicillium daleae]|uniref:Uncharacterized protein n=1 Tax=Penicillium daleae TaxID=63821 RepID=A0AAD6G1J5_9EURO|nr:uncharacterized protein N7458_008155 [Penicillium daleae]KAJ5444283.1 hypothetical protein N7458_008155 [Penicillium daleae]